MLLFLDKVYVERPDGSLRFPWVKVPASVELARLTESQALRIGRFLLSTSGHLILIAGAAAMGRNRISAA
jgi:hypothetical protein